MKERILQALRAAGCHLSGEEISERLGVSRTAIFKHVEGLRAQGYEIEAAPRLGYRLLSEPDLVTAEAIAAAGSGRFGARIEYRRSVGSTNELAKELARQGAPEGTLVVADEQTAGKGRLGRSWASQAGAGIWMSLILRPQVPPYQAPRLTLVAAVAVAEGVRQVTGLPAGIKWPNDLQLAGKKFCGILTEMEAELDRVAFVVCGMGINVRSVPAEFGATATSLQDALAGSELGARLERARIVRGVLSAFERWHGRPFPDVLARWKELSVTLGRRVAALPAAGGDPIEGVAVDLDEDGALLIDVGGTVQRVVAGEVSLRPAQQ